MTEKILLWKEKKMKRTKRLVSIGLTAVMAAALAAGCSGGKEGQDSENDNGGVTITLLNTKSELVDQFDALADEYKELTGVNIEVQFTSDVVSTHLSERYASGSPYTIMMVDRTDVYAFQDYLLDLSDEDWIADGGAEYGVNIDGKTYSFPLLVEAVGLLYNAQAIEDITGEEFNWTDYNTPEKFEGLLEELKAGGMESPVAVNQDDWSLANHFFGQLYDQQGNSEESSQAYVDSLKNGEVDLTGDARFNSLMDSFDTLLEYNINSADPLAADYDMNNEYFASGEVAFWFNGSWVTDVYSQTDKIGIMPLPQSDADGEANDRLIAGASKTFVIDKEYSTEEQQQAAKDFLNWLVYDEAGQSFMVDDCGIVPAFTNITKEVSTPISIAVQQFIQDGMTSYWYQAIPGDHGTEVGALLQRYMSGNMDREEFASAVEDYWTAQE